MIINPAQLPYGKISVIYGKTLEDVSNSQYSDNIFYSVKTTSQRQYYRKRLPTLMLTWFQAVNKNKVAMSIDVYILVMVAIVIYLLALVMAAPAIDL